MGQLKHKAISGFLWTSAGTVGAGAVSFLITLLLARLLNPSDFGLLELIIIAVSISSVIIDGGFSQALIRDNKATQTDLSSVFYLNIIIAIVIYLLLYFSAPSLAIFFDEEAFTSISRFCFLSIVLDSLGMVQIANFSRQMNFKPIAFANIVGVIIAGILGVVLAVNGWGIWALACNIVSLSLFRTFTLWILSKWKPSWCFSFQSVKKYFKFGSFLMFQSIIDKIVINFESLVIGKFYTKNDLAYFSQSRKVDAYFSQALTNVIQKVTYPALSKISDSLERLKFGYKRIIGLTTFVISPLMIFLFFFAEHFMMVTFGSDWIEAAPYLRLWSIFGLVYPIQSICNNIFYVTGKSKNLFYLSTIKQVSKVLIVIILVKYSVMAILVGIVSLTVFSALLYSYFSGRLIKYSLFEISKDVYKNILVSVFSATIVSQILRVIPIENSYIVFLIIVFLMIFFYALGSIIVKNENLYEVLGIVRNLYLDKIKHKRK